LQNRKRRLRKLAMTLFIVAVSAICYCTPLLDVLFLDQPFSSERWLTGDARARGRMVRDLLRSRLLEGKTDAEVEKLLGAADFYKYSGYDRIYRVDIGYRWIFQPILYEFSVTCPTKYGDSTAAYLDEWDGHSSDPFLWLRRIFQSIFP